MKKILMIWLVAAASLATMAQTLNVQVGEVVYAVPAADAGDMVYSGGQSLTILEKTFSIADIDRIYVDDSPVTAGTVSVAYNGSSAQVVVAADVMKHLTVTASGAHVSIVQDAAVASEITYVLSGTSSDGEFYMEGSYKATVELNGLTLTNPSGPAVNIQNGKRIAVSVSKGTTNTLTDGSGGDWKGCFRCKGHTEFKGKGVLNVYGNTSHAIWSKEYVEMKNCTINVKSAVGDGINCNQYFLMASGELNISGVGDDGIQVSYKTDDAGNVENDVENTGAFTLTGGNIDITVTGDGSKGIKAAGDVNISGGSVTITQSGNIVTDGSDIDYSTSIKAGGNITVTGGTVTVVNTAQGGKALSANGSISIDERAAATTIDLTANGIGGTAETAAGSTTPAASYKVYVSVPTSGGGGPGGGSRSWSSVYLYKSDGTFVQKLTSTVTKSSGWSSATFYYYDFKGADSGTYYFKSDDYSGGGGWGGSSTTYSIQSATFSAPATGSDVYYSISNSYTTSGTTRTYQLSNVTSTYGGTSETAEDSGTGYNAAGLKADGNITIGGGTITIANKGAMSKSIKSKGTVTVSGGNLTLTPSGAMQVINGDASYSTGIKAVDFVQDGGTISITATGTCARGISADNISTNGGTLTIVNSGAGQTVSSADYTAKGLKADTKIALNAGTINITMSGTGGKGIKSSGTYTQGVSGGNGPTLTVTTTGSSLGGTSGGWGGGWGGGFGSNGGSSAKAIKVMGAATLYGGETTVKTSTDGAEGLESKTSIDIQGGNHYFQCYDDCINSSGNIYFNGGVTVCYSNGNDAVDSNAGRTGAITIGNGVVFAYTSKGSPEEGLDCDNNSYIQITGNGIAISAGGSQGGGGWGGSSSSTISNAKQGYAFVTNSISYAANRYYTLADASGNNLVTYSFPASVQSSLSLITATGMKSGSTYNVKYSSTAPTDATTAFHGIYLGSSAAGTTSVASFTAK